MCTVLRVCFHFWKWESKAVKEVNNASQVGKGADIWRVWVREKFHGKEKQEQQKALALTVRESKYTGPKSHNKQGNFEPWPVWLIWLGIIPQIKRSWVRFQVGAHAWLLKADNQCFFLSHWHVLPSLSPSFPLSVIFFEFFIELAISYNLTW